MLRIVWEVHNYENGTYLVQTVPTRAQREYNATRERISHSSLIIQCFQRQTTVITLSPFGRHCRLRAWLL